MKLDGYWYVYTIGYQCNHVSMYAHCSKETHHASSHLSILFCLIICRTVKVIKYCFASLDCIETTSSMQALFPINVKAAKIIAFNLEVFVFPCFIVSYMSSFMFSEINQSMSVGMAIIVNITYELCINDNVQWKHNGSDILRDSRHILLKDQELLMKDVVMEDAGTYECYLSDDTLITKLDFTVIEGGFYSL